MNSKIIPKRVTTEELNRRKIPSYESIVFCGRNNKPLDQMTDEEYIHKLHNVFGKGEALTEEKKRILKEFIKVYK